MSAKSSNGNDDVSSDSIGESWVELGALENGGTPASITQQLTVEDYLRLLKEAQDSNQSSCRASLVGSCRDSLRGSPKSPPNSPVIQHTPVSLEWESFYMNKSDRPRDDILSVEWSSRPDSLPPKPWSFGSPRNDKFSLRYAKIGNTPLFSKRGLCIMFLTNLFSLLLGTGVGLFLNRNNYSGISTVKIR